MPTYTVNKKARFEYEVLETFEAGIMLHGHEVKSVKEGLANLKGSYATIDPFGEVYLLSAYISPYKKATHLQEYDPYHKRKLLLKKSEIEKLIGKLAQKGLTIAPLSMYSKGNKIKVELGLLKGKKKADKRESLKKKDIQRDIERTLKYRD